MNRIDDYIATADFLPPAFQLLPRLLLLLDDVDTNADALADLIRVDPGLTADILRVCNSAAYALTFPAENIQEAIFRLGFREVHRIVMTVIASPALKSPQSAYAAKEVDLWHHSLAAATASQTLVSGSGLDSDLVFTAALLHDIGKVVLAQAVPAEAAAAAAAAAETNQPLYKTERAQLKTDHAAVGARLLQRWGFPPNICTAIQYHHEPAACKTEVRLASAVCLANVLSYRLEEKLILPEYVLFPDSRALREMKLTQPAFESLAEEAREHFTAVKKNFL